YSAADVFVAPTLADNLPYTVLEAMGCGTPVVASAVGGVSEQVDHGVSGYLVPPGRSDLLGEALVSLLRDRNQRDAFARESRAKAERVFGMEAFVRAYQNVYFEMLEGSAPGVVATSEL